MGHGFHGDVKYLWSHTEARPGPGYSKKRVPVPRVELGGADSRFFKGLYPQIDIYIWSILYPQLYMAYTWLLNVRNVMNVMKHLPSL